MSKANEILKRLHANSPAGFAIGLHVQYTAPRYFFQSYEKEWLETYSSKGLLLNDPIVHWGFTNDGAIRWSGLTGQDHAGVLTEAARHGLKYGLAVGVLRGGSRSIAGFARGDREMTDIEVATILKDLRALHDETLTMMVLSPEIHDTLRQMSIFLSQG